MQMNYPKGFLDPGVENGVFIFKDGFDLKKFMQEAANGIKVAKQTYFFTKKIQENIDSQGKKVYYVRIPPLTSIGADEAFLQYGASAVFERYRNLKFIENRKQYFINADGLEVESQFWLSSTVIRKNISEGDALIGEFNLSDERLKALSNEYRETLVGKMNQILKDNQEVLSSMNAYFTSLSKENAENTFQAMTKVREGFKQFTTQATPGTPEPEETTET